MDAFKCRQRFLIDCLALFFSLKIIEKSPPGYICFGVIRVQPGCMGARLQRLFLAVKIPEGLCFAEIGFGVDRVQLDSALSSIQSLLIGFILFNINLAHEPERAAFFQPDINVLWVKLYGLLKGGKRLLIFVESIESAAFRNVGFSIIWS